MSSRIEEVLEVLEEIRAEYAKDNARHSIASLRVAAVQHVAKRRGISNESVRDKYIRQLKPEIDGTDEFDKCLKDWLETDRSKLKEVLLAKRVTRQDESRIVEFFRRLPSAETTEVIPNEKIITDNGNETILYPEEILSGKKYLEGNIRRIPINIYERSPKAKKACIAKFGPTCMVCGLSFSERYGEIGKDFIHVHHLELISAKGAYEVDPIRDLQPVCPNCHAMIHKRVPPYTIEELKRIIKDAQKMVDQLPSRS